MWFSFSRIKRYLSSMFVLPVSHTYFVAPGRCQTTAICSDQTRCRRHITVDRLLCVVSVARCYGHCSLLMEIGGASDPPITRISCLDKSSEKRLRRRTPTSCVGTGDVLVCFKLYLQCLMCSIEPVIKFLQKLTFGRHRKGLSSIMDTH